MQLPHLVGSCLTYDLAASAQMREDRIRKTIDALGLHQHVIALKLFLVIEAAYILDLEWLFKEPPQANSKTWWSGYVLVVHQPKLTISAISIHFAILRP